MFRRHILPLAFLLAVGGCAAGDDAPAPTTTAKATGAPRIVFARNDVHIESPNDSWDIYVMRPGGSGLRNLTGTAGRRTDEEDDHSPVWSPDGRRIAFSSTRGHDGDGLEDHEIWVMRFDGSGQRRLTFDADADFNPHWTRDGRIAFVHCALGDEPECRLEVVGPDGQNRQTLVGELGLTFAAELSPDGAHVVVVRNEPRRAKAKVVIRDVDDGDERAVAELHSFFGAATWSPDGRRVAFLTDRDRNGPCLFHDCAGHAPELYVIDAGGGGERRLTRTQASEAFPRWTPDGSAIIFGRIADEDADYDLHAVDPDGTCERQLTSTAAWEWTPDWFGRGPGRVEC